MCACVIFANYNINGFSFYYFIIVQSSGMIRFLLIGGLSLHCDVLIRFIVDISIYSADFC